MAEYDLIPDDFDRIPLKPLPLPSDPGIDALREQFLAAIQRRPLPHLIVETPPTLLAPAGAYGEIAKERDAQEQKWGQQNHADGTGRPGDVEAMLAARARCQANGPGQDTWRDILLEEVTEAFAEIDPWRIDAELTQIAAVVVAWKEAIGRRLAHGSAIRYCSWIGCTRQYDAITEAGLKDVAFRWYNYRNSVLICGPHHDLGHAFDFRFDRDAMLATPTCACGWEGKTAQQTRGQLIDRWRLHALMATMTNLPTVARPFTVQPWQLTGPHETAVHEPPPGGLSWSWSCSTCGTNHAAADRDEADRLSTAHTEDATWAGQQMGVVWK